MSGNTACAGCGHVLTEVHAIGMWIAKDGSGQIPYMLCGACVAEAQQFPQRVADRVELRIAPAVGRA